MIFLFLYNVIIILLSPLILCFFFLRILKKKEIRHRYLERFGNSTIPRPRNKRLLWVHACSVGETNSASSLINKFLDKNYNVLVTSNTVLSYYHIETNFSKKVMHQFLPLDYIHTVKKFLTYWKPDLAILIESELWPNLINLAKKKKIPLFLLQASISEKSFKRWKYFNGFFLEMLKSFNLIVAQSKTDKEKLFNRGVNAEFIFNLKQTLPKLETDRLEIKKIKKKIKDKVIISAISTHSGEDKIFLKAFSSLKKKYKSIILFLQPRHPKRSEEIENYAKKYKLQTCVRSKKNYPTENTELYLFDTFGESGNIIEVSDIIILGGTFVPIGGHNLMEPAKFGKCIICGIYNSKIKDIVDEFKKNKAIISSDSLSLTSKLEKVLQNKKQRKNYAKNALNLTNSYKNKEEQVFKKIQKNYKNIT